MGDGSRRGAEPLNGRLVESMGHGLLLLDRAGRVRLANRAARERLGLAGDLEGREAATVLAQIPTLAHVAAQAVADPAGRGLEAVQVVVQDELRLLGVHRAPLGGDGLPDGVVLSFTDLTGFRTVQLREHTTAALAGLARLSAFVAHELKNPLGALKLYALLLERHCREARPELRELADKVARAIDQLSTVINEATGFGLPGAFEPAAVALVPLMDDALGSVEARAGDTGVQVVRRYEGAGVTARADARGLRQAIVAFLTHALDAMPEGGTLTVGVGQRGPAEAELSVQDSGPGLAPEIRARLFEPFFTTRGAGTGLEMLIASQIIEQHGGRIEVHSQPGGGTTIRVILPAAAQAEDNARRTHSGR